MNGFFKPLRRKMGVVTLALACVFSGAWLRSLSTFDAITISSPFQQTLEILSQSGRLEVNFWFNRSEMANFLEFESDVADPFDWTYASVISMTVSNFSSSLTECYVTSDILYSLIVVPLTLLSAWLLLSRPLAQKAP